MNTTLKTRLSLMMGIMSILLLVLGGIGLYAMTDTHNSLKNNYEEHVLRLDKIASIDKLLLRNRYAMLEVLADPRPEKLKASADDLERARRMADQLWLEFAAAPMSQQARKTADEFVHFHAIYDDAVTLPLILALRHADTGKIREIGLLSDKLKTPIITGMDSLRVMQLEAARKEYEAAQAAYGKFRYLICATLLLGLALAAALTYILVHSIYRQVGGEPAYAAQVARQIAAGDLDVSIALQAQDEGSLLASLQQLQSGLEKAIKGLGLNTAGIARTTGQVLSGNMSLVTRTGQQAAAYKQVVAGIRDLGSGIRHNGERTREAVQLASEANELAIKSGQTAMGVVSIMGQIQSASSKIFDNIHVVDELAFQIDTLILKATVEDKSAGDAGDNFAATAAEVRELAQCVSCIAKEIKNHLNENLEKLENASKQASKADSSFEQICSTLQHINSLMSNLNISTRRQDAGIKLINHTVSDMEQANLKDGALLAVTTTAVRSLEIQTERLAQVARGLRLDASSRTKVQLQVVNTVAEENTAPKRPNLRLVHP